MSVKNTFREVAIQLASKHPEMVEYTLEEAPIMEMMPMEPSSGGLTHAYEELLSVTGAGINELDSELSEVNANTELRQMQLSTFGGLIEVGEDKASMLGGPTTYFDSKLPAILKKTGSAMETSVLYNNLRASAVAAKANTSLPGRADHLISAGGSDNTNYSILCVKWEMGNLSGLYDPSGFGKGMLFDMKAVNGGELYFLKSLAQKVLGYGLRLKSHFGVLTANPRNVAAIVNIDVSSDDTDYWKLPTANMIDDIIQAVRGTTGGSTMLLMHPKVASALNEYKAARLQTTVETSNFKRTYEAWNGVPIVQSYNFKRGDEANVTVA